MHPEFMSDASHPSSSIARNFSKSHNQQQTPPNLDLVEDREEALANLVHGDSILPSKISIYCCFFKIASSKDANIDH